MSRHEGEEKGCKFRVLDSSALKLLSCQLSTNSRKFFFTLWIELFLMILLFFSVIDDKLHKLTFKFSFSDNNDSLSSFDELPGSTSSSQPRFKSEILCNSQEQDKFLSDFGLESSLLLDLNPGRTIHSCKRFFSSPDSNGLLIRLIKSSEIFNDSSTIVDNFKENNISEFCPISIVSFDRPCH